MNLFNTIDRRVVAMVREFAEAMGFAGTPEHRKIYWSSDFPDTRQVWQVVQGADIYALKLDFEADAEGRLAKEYGELLALRAHFAKYDKLGLVTPVYLSPSGQFCVTEFLNHKTAGQRLHHTENDQARRQIYRRAGAWLHALHEFAPQKKKEFWGNWMLKELDEIVDRGEMQADPDDVARMRKILHGQIRAINKTRDIHASSHGDFHSENMMMGPGMTYGFDFTEARAKMAVYDIVDFLKVDVHRATPADQVDRAGITTAHRAMFFKGYRHDINHDVLDVALRGRLLIDWVQITREKYATSEGRQSAFHKQKFRLDIAFAPDQA